MIVVDSSPSNHDQRRRFLRILSPRDIHSIDQTLPQGVIGVWNLRPNLRWRRQKITKQFAERTKLNSISLFVTKELELKDNFLELSSKQALKTSSSRTGAATPVAKATSPSRDPRCPPSSRSFPSISPCPASRSTLCFAAN